VAILFVGWAKAPDGYFGLRTDVARRAHHQQRTVSRG
jgi:hypothetical protein